MRKSRNENRQIPLKYDYINWEGKRAVRAVIPIKIWFGKTEWHKTPQWFLKAHDVEKDVDRDFAVKDILKFL